MKSIIRQIAFAACAIGAASAMVSCVSDEPFSNEEGALKVKMVINNDLTRAETDNIDLGASTVLYISNSKGLIRKYQGQENIPDRIPLQGGHYLAEAWAGDSVSASFDKKFYQGSQEFDIAGADTEITLRCGIANVVASINKQTVDAIDVSDLKITIGHSRGTLDFTADNIEAKGYYMMPSTDKDLKYTISGVNADGVNFSLDGTIPEVKKGHEYILNISNNPTYDEIGGAFLTVTIDDRVIEVNSEVTILGRPAITGDDGLDISKQIYAPRGSFKDATIKIKAFGSLSHIYINSDQSEALGLPSAEIDLLNMTSEATAAVKAKGIEWETIANAEKNTVTGYVYLKAAYLNSLSDGQYQFTLTAHDSYGKYTPALIRIGVGEGSQVIDDPVVLDDIHASGDMMSVLARRATLTGRVIDASKVPSLQFRESGTEAWTSVELNGATEKQRRVHKAAGQQFKVELKGLKPGTRYEYRAVTDGWASESMFLTTESLFEIPNASFEDWSTYRADVFLAGEKDVVFPGTGSTRSFWDSGNEGAASAGKTLTNKSADMSHSGSFAARLASDQALGILAAGNVFAGTYVKTDRTNGVLSLGREFNGSHPDKVAVWANYRPGTVDIVKSGNESYLDFAKGDNDHGQIYVALTTGPIEIRTNPSNRKLFPNKDGDEDREKVIAYGEVTWKGAFGPDGQLQKVEVPLTYFAGAKTAKPTHLVIVCCASKFGDFFSGSSKSVLYLDDFELVYE